MKNNLIAVMFVCISAIAAIFAFKSINPTTGQSDLVKHDVAVSSDSETIAYSVYGSGNTALVFVHGWAGDSRYWVQQLGPFAESYKIITLDLAGHGHSSMNRVDYTMSAFAKDVQAVLEFENIDRAILIGHSMGGAVIVSTAEIIPQKVKGLIGVDAFHDVSAKRTQEMVAGAIKPFQSNYPQTMEYFLGSLFSTNTPENLKRWISRDMASAEEPVAVSALHNFMLLAVTGETASAASNIKVPVISINATLRPTNLEGNEKSFENYELVTIQDTGHFPMLEVPLEFNALLLQAIQKIESGSK